MLAFFCYGQNPDNSVEQQIHNSAASSPLTSSNVNATIRLTKYLSTRWEFELEVRNSGNHSVFVMSDPVRMDNSRGVYLTINKENSAILEMSLKLFPRPKYLPLTFATCVTLKRLAPNEIYKETIILYIPLQQTDPPYEDTPNSSLRGKQFIDIGKIGYVKAEIGILPDEEGIQDFMKHKEGVGPFAYGLEKVEKGIFKGKNLLELQTTIYTDVIHLSDSLLINK